jgi:glutamate-5-semialdehyde dehydrogenase
LHRRCRSWCDEHGCSTRRSSALTTHEIALAAKHASRLLAPLDEAARNAALEAMAKALEAASAELMAANAKDMHGCGASASGEDKLPPATTSSRLKLNPAKLREMVEQVRSVAALPDPLGRTLDAIELDDKDAAGAKNATHGLHLQKISVPLGVLAVIFEARPDAVTQIAALALKVRQRGDPQARQRGGANRAALVRVYCVRLSRSAACRRMPSRW